MIVCKRYSTRYFYSIVRSSTVRVRTYHMVRTTYYRYSQIRVQKWEAPKGALENAQERPCILGKAMARGLSRDQAQEKNHKKNAGKNLGNQEGLSASQRAE